MQSTQPKIKLMEIIFRGLATLFHRSKIDNKSAFRVTTGAHRSGTAIFGGGFYTTYSIESQLNDRMIKNYGEYVFKLAAKVTGFFYFDKKLRDKAMSGYNSQQKEAVKKIEELVKDDDDFNDWNDAGGQAIYVINKYQEVEQLIRENFEGMIYTIAKDGQCALIFDPTKSYVQVLGVAKVDDPNVDLKSIVWKKIKR